MGRIGRMSRSSSLPGRGPVSPVRRRSVRSKSTIADTSVSKISSSLRGFAACVRFYFLATSTGVSATEMGDRRSINEIKNATPITIPPITNGVLP